MKKINILLSIFLFFMMQFHVISQIAPTSSPYYVDGPYSITSDSVTVSSKKVVIYHPVTAPTGVKYPVFIFQPGANGLFSSAINVHSYDLYLKHLAIYGYVVLVIDETAAGMPNGTTFKAVHDWFLTNVTNTSSLLYTYADSSKVAIGGHSNGGVNASGCLVDRPGKIDAIVYFASYPSNNILVTQDVSGYTGKVLDLAGADDQSSKPADCLIGYNSFTSANCAYWVLITGMDHGGFGDYVNTSQPVGAIGRTDATATVRHYFVSFLNYIFKNDVVAQSNFETTVLQPSTTNQFTNSCITTIIEENYENNFKFYPNPVNNFAQLYSIENINSFKLIDITGKDVTNYLKTNTTDIHNFLFDFSDINNGLYLLYIQGNESKPIKINVIH
ncbi:MAG TPA: alpha/beta hydrolase [Bacteroidales bacterium]|nr:alpha/beta hydrolase [Bacteroidales bacterium]HPS16805.1 alpha/beta hydrolase [Bacteroidales bacterium]